MRARRAVLGATAAAFLLGGGIQAAYAADDYSRPGPFMSVGFSWGKEAMDVEDLEESVTADRVADQFAKAVDDQGVSLCTPDADGLPSQIPCRTNALVDRMDSPGADIRVGYRFNETFAADLNFQYFDQFEMILRGTNLRRLPGNNLVQDTLGDQDIAEITSYSLFANLRAYPWTGIFQPYGAVGVGVLYAEVDTQAAEILTSPATPNPNIPTTTPRTRIESGSDEDVVFGGRFGGGFDYYLSKNLALNFDVSWTLTTQIEVDTMSEGFSLNHVPITTGIVYRFD